MKRRIRRPLAKQQSNQNRYIAAILLAIALLLLGGSLYAYLAEDGDSGAALVYDQNDVVQDKPIFAIHEMGEGPPIPFLPSDQPQPELALSSSSYDFGSIGPFDKVNHKFAIFNQGKSDLTISRAYTTCGCTTADISAQVIPPGKVAEVILTFDAGFHDTAGQTVRRGLIIENNDPRHSKAEIWIQATVRNS